MGKWTFINNEFVAADAACLSVSDLSIQRGYGIFDYLKVTGNRIIFIDEHLQRFYRSAAAMHLSVPFTKTELSTIIQELVSKNALEVSGVRITLTGGTSPDGYSITTPNLVITQNSFSLPTSEAIQKGLYLISKEHQRQLAHVKTIDYLMAISLQPSITASGADDVLYTHNNAVSECPRANLFIVTKEGTLATPCNNVLNGITRSKVLELAATVCTVEEKDITLTDVYNAAEVFITSTTKGILPVRKIDDREYPSCRPVTKNLSQLLVALHNRYQTVAE